MQEESIFIEALERDDPADRAAFLDRACAGDEALRQRVERLLLRHEQADSVLDQPDAGQTVTEMDSPSEPSGATIGPYKLLEPIGEGGMGTVYMAEQARPIRRLVAVKVIKAGMDSRQVLARFEAERQALALMDHPNIAKVLDAGTTQDGRPYFVMELVKGIPITRFCDERRLTLRERLGLFIPVCQAVQHAHQKGIIHRDLKPSNVLVGLYDGVPVPKVIDFGVAKATGQKLTEATLFTAFGTVVGTPEYMSPEQAQLENLDVDTRSDVYSLGVLLYELLTGSTPLDRRRLNQAGILEILRVIREEEPLLPSIRLSTTEELASIAATRGVEPRRLTGLVRGELDWIVMKAIEKDRSRRYATANGLGDDLRRYLDDEPVQAGPPSARYRLLKLARRHRVAMGMACLVLLALAAAAFAGVVSHRNRIAEERRQAERRALEFRLVSEMRERAVERAIIAAMGGSSDEAEEAIGQSELLGASTGEVRLLRGQVAFQGGDVALATRELEQAVKLMPESVTARAILAQAYLNGGQTEPMEQLWQTWNLMEPKSPEDYLYKGYVESLIRPEAGQPLLDQAVRMRNSIIARGIRCEARANLALVSGEVRDAELALEDAAAARGMLPDNTFVLSSGVYARLVAADIYGDMGRIEDRRRVLEEAGRDVPRLRHHTSSPIAMRACYWYFTHLGDEPAALKISREGNEYRHVCMLYRRGEYGRALQAASRAVARGYSLSRIEAGFALAELDDGPARALEMSNELMAHPDHSLIGRMCPPLILLLLGRPEEAARAGLQIRDRRAAMPSWYGDWYLKYLDFHCGLLSESDFLKAAGMSRGKLCDAYFLTGLRRLAVDDRAGAREHFRRCIQTRAFIFWDYDWAWAFLRRLEEDPAWPKWIPRPVRPEARRP